MRTAEKQGSHAAVSLDPAWKTLLECSALEVFEMMAGVRLQTSAAPSESRPGEQTAMVGMAGALCGMTTLRCSRETSAKLATLMLGGDSRSNASTARDALGELCNMIAGNFKGKVSHLAEHCMLSVPTVITGDDYSMSPLNPTEGLSVDLSLDDEPISVSLIIHS
jgi:chemotaxis protein CheX